MQPLLITLDGPAGSGKSTVARQLGLRLGLEFLDTGAMYRGLTAVCLDQDINPAVEPEKVLDLARRVRFRFDWETDPPRLFIAVEGNHVEVTGRLRDADVTAGVSAVAALTGVRQVLVTAQQQIGHDHPRLVTEGRDQGSVVFPQAQAKFYLDARPEIRAQRRAEQLHAAGKPADAAQILAGIIQRDRLDSTRSDGPLICPADALRIDTSAMSLQEVVDMLEKCVRQRCTAALRTPSGVKPAAGFQGGDKR